jgi:hypothetical protein
LRLDLSGTSEGSVNLTHLDELDGVTENKAQRTDKRPSWI